jgi:hypothetical protein
LIRRQPADLRSAAHERRQTDQQASSPEITHTPCLDRLERARPRVTITS